MKDAKVTDFTITLAKESSSGLSHIEDEFILLATFADVSLSAGSYKVHGLFAALCSEGTARYTVDGVEYTIQANDLMIISDGQVVSDYQMSRDCRGVAMIASNNFYHELIQDVHDLSSLFLFAHIGPILHLKKDMADDFMVYFKKIKEKVDRPAHHFQKELVMSLLKALIYDVGNEIWLTQQSDYLKYTRAEKIFMDFIKLVEQNFRTERRVSWYASQLCITAKYLSEIIKRVSRRTPNEWIDNYVILEVRALLRISTKSLKEIADELHFCNQSFFGKYFKHHVGISPSKYRKGSV